MLILQKARVVVKGKNGLQAIQVTMAVYEIPAKRSREKGDKELPFSEGWERQAFSLAWGERESLEHPENKT